MTYHLEYIGSIEQCHLVTTVGQEGIDVGGHHIDLKDHGPITYRDVGKRVYQVTDANGDKYYEIESDAQARRRLASEWEDFSNNNKAMNRLMADIRRA